MYQRGVRAKNSAQLVLVQMIRLDSGMHPSHAEKRTGRNGVQCDDSIYAEKRDMSTAIILDVLDVCVGRDELSLDLQISCKIDQTHPRNGGGG
jgi:hypothetical protein